MANAIAVNGSASRNSNTACPNADRLGHTSSNIPADRLTSAQVRAALETINIAPGSRLARYARYRAFTAGIDADDLLQEAILRAMTSRSCPAHIAVDHFLMGVLRSIASKVIEKRERAEDALLQYGGASPNAPLPPDAALAFAERADICRRSIEKIAEESPTTQAVVDGIAHGLCGKALAAFANVDQSDLATVRRTIKRRVASIWTKLAELDDAA